MYKRILVPVDGSPTSNLGLAEAISLARLGGAQLCVMHVVDFFPLMMGAEGGMYVGEALAQMRESGEQILATTRAQVEAAGIDVDVVLEESSNGRVCDLVVEQAKQWKADLIVMGTHGRTGLLRLVMGSVAEAVVRRAPCPVLTFRAPHKSEK